MPFDFRHIAVPFRMQPGLHRMAPEAVHLSTLDPDDAVFPEKQQVSSLGQAVFCQPGFDTDNAIAAIRAQALRDGILLQAGPLELQLLQDLAVLDLATGCVPWMCVCLPSGWAPEDKLGLSLAAIHAPVADSAGLAAAWPHLARLLAGGSHWERFVWSISPSPRHDQHPRRRPRQPWPRTSDPVEFAHGCYLRSERQTFFPVLARDGRPLAQAVFTITVALQPLTDAVRDDWQARRLHDALQSMSPAVQAYKGLAGAQVRLLQWLTLRAGDNASVANVAR